ncbi:MAG: DUF5717 family protein, partial [Lachnospiraceae bacterium]|nr:DUF5717 family protein [Lachnospiraceae bacterium]
LDELIAWDDRPVYSLMKAQLYLANGRRQDAEWLLDDYRRAWDGIEDATYGYYLYVTSLYNREESYVIKLIDKVNDIYLRNRENALLFFCILNLNADYVKDRQARYAAIRNYVGKYGHSYTLETEALCILFSEPYCASSFEPFTKRLFFRAVRYGYADERLCQRIIQLAFKDSTKDKVLRALLEKADEIVDSEESITVLCSYLVRNQIRDERAFAAFEKGIENNVRVAGIYEAYLQAMDKRSIKVMPHILLMYFKAHSHLPYQEKALLFVNIIANKENDPETYEDYKDQIVAFAYEQLDILHIDDSLAVIYGDVFSNNIRIREVASQLSYVMFVHRITCFDDGIKYVVVREDSLKNEMKVPVKNNIAYVNIYTNDRLIILEDVEGNRFLDPNMYQLEMLMPAHRYLKTCLKYAPDEYAYILSYFKNKTSPEGAVLDDIYMLENLLTDDRTRDEYKNKLAMRFCDFLDDRGRADIVMRAINFEKLSEDERLKYVTLLINNSALETAYRFIREYSIFNLDVQHLYRVASFVIREADGQDEFELTDICMRLFERGCTKPDLLMYLERNITGPSKTLERVLKAVRQADLPRQNLTERLITQSLFSTEYISSSQVIFEDYAKEGDPEVIDAYLAYHNHLAFSEDVIEPERLFLYTKERVVIDDNAPMIMKLSLARYLIEQGNIEKTDEKMILMFVSEWIEKGLYFRFYKKLPHELQEKLHIADQTIIEYKTESGKRVKINYRLSESEEYISEDLPEMYCGIYVWHTVIFFGETLQYYISEESLEGEEALESGKIDNLGISGNSPSSRYDYINEVLMAFYLGENEAKERMIRDYLKKSREVRNLFELMG